MKCTVFGGGGFIGSAITERLLSAGHALRIVERAGTVPYRTFSPAEQLEWVSGDMFDAAVLERTLKGTDVAVHLVSTTLPKNSDADPIHDVETNLLGSLRLLEAVVKNDVKKILFISSGGTVYGIPEYLPIDEKHPTNPLVSYGVTKLAIEKFLQLHARKHGIQVRILRVANPYGQRQQAVNAQGAATAFLRRAASGEPIEIWGDGSAVRDYLHIDDVAEAFLKAMEYEGRHQVFNIGSGCGTSLNELAEIAMEATGRSCPIRHLPSRGFDVPANVLCNKLAGDEMLWKPGITLRDGLGLMAKTICG
jgi:UDP-glucose 4-epimerase